MELNIWLDTYDDLYSDFDSRKFSKRLVSEDFIHELKRNAKEVKGAVSVLLLHLPAEVRKPQVEDEILQSLKGYFLRQHMVIKSEVAHIFRKGIAMALVGTLLLIVAAYLHFLNARSFLNSVIQIILEPAGWFLIWNGLDILFYEIRIRRSQLNFFDKIRNCNLQFVSSN